MGANWGVGGGGGLGVGGWGWGWGVGVVVVVVVVVVVGGGGGGGGGGGQWDGWPMRRGTNEMGVQWRAPPPPCIRTVMFKMLCHDHKCIPVSSRCIPDEFFGDIGRRP